MNLIDIGLNLTHDSFDRDRDAVMRAAADAGVSRCVITGTSLEGSMAARDMAASRRNCFATAGVHPHHASEYDAGTSAGLRQLLDDPLVVAAGECGLDFFRNFSPREVQLRALEAQLELAMETSMPLFLHQRDAHVTLMDMLRAHPSIAVAGGIVHCFTDGPDELRDILDLGLHVGITGWLCDERRGESLRAAVRFAPLDRLMVETDAPYLLPRDLPKQQRGKDGRRNEPRHLPHIVTRLAEIVGETPERVASVTTANAERLFRLPPPCLAADYAAPGMGEGADWNGRGSTDQ